MIINRIYNIKIFCRYSLFPYQRPCMCVFSGISAGERDFFLSSRKSRPALGPTQPYLLVGNGFIFRD